MNIGDKISKAIKEGKWLNISYVNQKNETTYYWIAINDIEFNTCKLKVFAFNDKKSLDTFEYWISFDNIKSADVIEFSSYDVPQNLIDKIEKNFDRCAWLNYDHFNHNVLNYYAECHVLDNDPCQKEFTLIPGIDLKTLRKNKVFKLTDEQIRILITEIYHYDLKKNDNSFYTLAINCFSIDEGKKKFVICYYALAFNPIKKSLVINNNLRFNKTFMVDGRKHSLFNYINMDMDEFEKTFVENFDKYQAIINEHLRPGEIINTRPDIMLIQRDMPVDLTETYNNIELKYHQNKLPTPLKSFFGNISNRNNRRKKEPSLVIYDKRININQMRVLYNAIKYPVTYVQGPPGTGKTQTIVNVVLSAFYNDKTVLVCSSNNKPVNGIIEKLEFKYRNEAINFPYLRLGNVDDVKKATLRIKKLYEYSTDKVAKDYILNKIKVSNDEGNNKLIKLLNIQERRLEIEDLLESADKLIESFGDNISKITEHVKEKIKQLQDELANLPEITNEELISLFIPLNENNQLSQYLFYKSLQYIEKLKKPKYEDLIAICRIEDDDTRVSEFNKWTSIDLNMKKLVEVFPIIFSTNISSKRLGSPNFMFDLVIMDEAGQCNSATALIPIAKAESLLLVGDPNQLKPVIILEEQVNNDLKNKYNVPDEYDYKTKSILDVMIKKDNVSKYILLKYHYRCGKKIIGFSNQRYYNNTLNVSSIKFDGELGVINVKNQNEKAKNEAIDEAIAIVDYIERNKITNASIITPFVNQKELIQKLLKEKNISEVDCGTIHSLQGAEKDTIILSTALSMKTSKKTFQWIKNNYELINVATTRAKNKLIISADMEHLERLSDGKDDLYNLIQYAKNNGKIVIPPNESVKIEIGKSNGSVAEDEFFKTISQFCTCNKSFDAERNVNMYKIIKKQLPPSLERHEFDLVLYEKNLFGKKPVIAFEINGGEHFGVIAREQSDRVKMDVCAINKIKLIIIPNSFVKAYEYISQIIYASKNKSLSIQQSMFDDYELGDYNRKNI